MHGEIESLGFRIDGLAYSPDISALPDESRVHLGDLDVWILDALRPTPHPSHLSVSQACELAQQIAPRRTILTHLHVDLDYRTLAEQLPSGFEPAYDGMTVESS